ALKSALREDPDGILVGEMRDYETIALALTAAETGHLVFGTLHTTSAPSTVDRIIDQFPTDRQEQIRVMLSESLRGVIAQVLCKKIGGGRAAAHEILIGNNAVANLIREGKTFQLKSVMQTARNIGMQTMNDHIVELVVSGKVDPMEGYMKTNDKFLYKELLAKKNIKLEINDPTAV
ncbi:MAG: Flp pilus assembly complex ATPase component TadA, partial [Myxococcales bacterium]|nr:Flp pilus assembly complex ATPase component TadA [Myxococcales bacterium]